MINKIAPLVLVAFLWGATNPLIKKGSKDRIKIHSPSRVKQFLYELKHLLTNINFIIPWGLNQLGSVLYFLSLKDFDVSVAVPVTNSLTFIFTAVMGIILGEKTPGKKTYLGMMLILLGSYIICYDRYSHET